MPTPTLYSINCFGFRRVFGKYPVRISTGTQTFQLRGQGASSSSFRHAYSKLWHGISLPRPFPTNSQSPVVTIRTASLTLNNSTFCPHSVFMCFVWIWEQTDIISLYSIDCLVFITETECLLRGPNLVAKCESRYVPAIPHPHLFVSSQAETANTWESSNQRSSFRNRTELGGKRTFNFQYLNGFFNRSIIVKKPLIHKQAARLCNKHSDNCTFTFTCTCQTE